ncbi:MAG: molybdenum cofactor biosynthesis protein MoaE [Proteobacteria bacterium]|nr:molybdenum cofactor biosynthesis protein MoaE [Pseudomonadota bacterium]
MKIEIRDAAFDPWREVQDYQEQCLAKPGKYGATAVFVGTMRDFNAGERVHSMHLEHYPEMTQGHLQQIAQEAARRWEILDALLLHRVGQVFPGDPIVCVAIWSAHRDAAYEANRFIMEDLKSKSPIWKKEHLSGRQRWLTGDEGKSCS